VQKALNEKLLEAQSAQGFIAGRCLVHLAADRGARKSLEALLDSGCQVTGCTLPVFILHQ